MFGITFNRPLVALAVTAGVLVAAAPAGAFTAPPGSTKGSFVEYTDDALMDNRHAAERPVFSGDAYDNEMGVVAGPRE